MKCNVGGIDRSIRIVAGLALISVPLVFNGTPWGYLGIIPLVTGLVGWCPGYFPFGISTCKSCK